MTPPRELVLKELHHRLHNNLRIVISLLRITEKTLENQRDREQLADLGQRIQALSALQEEFYRSEDFRRVNVAGFLERLARNLIGLAGGRVTLSSDLEEAEMLIDLAVPFGLMANEVITNALKHAFPDGRTGHLSVRLTQAEERLDLTVADDGAGYAGSMRTEGSGLGMRLVRRLAGQIGAEMSFEGTGTGTICRIGIPM
ncbi:sensor histidine kinase [Microvirga sp. TS319]|uniref:sensor histidine kinase n=1 Tax=Microvirga sp. TS319 TaxID=3241165 RepID=UPI00351A486F